MEQYCREADDDGRSSMAMIKTRGEQKTIQKIVRTAGSWHWIGLVRVGQNNLYWYRNFEANDPPITLQEVTYSHYHSGEPNNSGNNQHCVAMHYADGSWYDYECNSYGFYAVCELRC